MSWRPSAALADLQKRALFLEAIRLFFKERAVLALETPVLGAYTGTDPGIESLSVYADKKPIGYLQTSPEFCMKRFLAAYPEQAIYQITPAFRAEEQGAWHSSEFTLLEWYRPGWTLPLLAQELAALVERIMAIGAGPEAAPLPVEEVTYAQLFEQYYGFCPHTAPLLVLEDAIAQRGWSLHTGDPQILLSEREGLSLEIERDLCLDILMSHGIEPFLGQNALVFVYDYPASMAALARIEGQPPVAKRFECYYQGRELANAYDECVDQEEQRRRFEADNAKRAHKGLPKMDLDPLFLEALPFLPAGVGVALGLDRLFALALGKQRLSEIRSFS